MHRKEEAEASKAQAQAQAQPTKYRDIPYRTVLACLALP
jgi:hypothetical protein